MSFEGLCEEISGCRTVSEARQVCQRRGFVPPPPAPYKGSFYDPRETQFLTDVEALGGFSDCHGHADRAYSIQEMIETYGPDVCQRPMTEKWELTTEMERNSSPDQYLQRILKYMFASIDHGVTYIATNVDADPSSGTRALEAAQIVRALFKRNPADDSYGNVIFRFGAHPHEGFFTNGKIDMRKVRLYEYGCMVADFCGGLPSRDGRIGAADETNFNRHLDIVLRTGAALGKNCGIHIDQQNSVHENETLRLLEKIEEHKMVGNVIGVHGVSLSKKEPKELEYLIERMKAVKYGLIICPSAAISMEAPNEVSRTSGSLAPIPALMKAGIPLFLGGDNRADIYMPNTNGDMLREVVFAEETARFYELPGFVTMATAIPFLMPYDPNLRKLPVPGNRRSFIEPPKMAA